MLSGKVLNSGASLNSYKEIKSLDFIVGEDLTLKILLYNTSEGIRYIPKDDSVITLIFNKGNSGRLEKIAVKNPDDRSMLTVILSGEDTLDLVGGNIKIELKDKKLKDDGDQAEDSEGNPLFITTKGLIENGIRKIVVN